MSSFEKIISLLQKKNPLTLTNVPEGYEGFILTELFHKNSSILYVARDEKKLQEFERSMKFYAPDLPFFTFFDISKTPYDRVSPKSSLIAKRVQTLLVLSEKKDSSTPIFLATTLSALLQKIPLPEFFRGRSLSLKEGESFSFKDLQLFLETEGYRRVEVVFEAGEYAIRGGILDLFSAALDVPVRLDFFGEALQSISPFDPLTQLKILSPLSEIIIPPSKEILLTDDAIRSFRTAYRSFFGASATEDPLYQAITQKISYPGIENWMPLFFDQLGGLWDYLRDPIIAVDFQFFEIVDILCAQIQDHYENRLQDMKAYAFSKKAFSNTEVYRALSPDLLYWNKETLKSFFNSSKTLEFSPFQNSSTQSIDMEGGASFDWAFLRTRIKTGVLPREELFEEVTKFIRSHLEEKKSPLILVGYSPASLARLCHILEEHHCPSPQKISCLSEIKSFPAHFLFSIVLTLEHGFQTPFFTLVTEQDILGERLIRPALPKKKSADRVLEELSSFIPGDLVVHAQHGIGRYKQLLTLDINNSKHDCLELHYEGGDKLFVPVENMDVLSRFGSDTSDQVLDKLGASQWQARKARVKKRLKEIAEKLISIAAKRSFQTSERLTVSPGLYEEFCARFPFVETEDQLRVTEEIVEDLSGDTPMDRLVCGDVGFGKTEIALRAAFIAASNGKQVAIVAPTTLLARQHFKTFEDRFAGLGFKIVQLSRLVNAKEALLAKKSLQTGEASILIATHAAFSKSIIFKDFGLLIVDEEQHFGVTQKEVLREKYPSLHILTLTATPIPRTLHLALSGVRDLSLITTPPIDRMAVKTFVMPFDRLVIKEALLREHYRGGQSFYVAPRIEDLPPLKTQLSSLVPELKVGIAHGRLSPSELESLISAFYDKKFDVLLSTNIVESGLDIPSANTLIVHKSDYFGLSQLYQLRGRIGRSKVRGYAYLTYSPGKILTETATRRLSVLETLDTLGVGFSIASHDMDIRGAGNLVGEEQSGHIKEVGIELYQHMLKEAIDSLTNLSKIDNFEDKYSAQIIMEGSVLIPEDYVSDLSLRLSLYRRMSHLKNSAEIESFADEMIDRFGPYPISVQNLLDVITLKRLAESAGIEKIEIGPKGIVLTFHKNVYKNPAGLVDLLNKSLGTLKLRPDHKLLFARGWASSKARFTELCELLHLLGNLTAL